MVADQENGKTQLFEAGVVIDGKWVLMEQIGEGGMGVVYRAHQLNLKRDVAIKVISEDMLADLQENPEELDMAVKRFEREVQTMAQVRHPNVLQIYDYGSASLQKNGASRQVEYIAMEYVPGNTLRYTMSEQGFEDETELLTDWLHRYFLPVTDGIAAIHAHGIVHRDMKPENILMDGEVPKIADFGLARSLKFRCVTDSCDLKGTWPYMAPEQFAEFRKAGPTADIYALGKILYEAVAGKLDQTTPPFRQVGLKETLTPLLKAVGGIIQKATSEAPEQRYQTVAEFKKEVLQALDTISAGRQSEALKTTPHPRTIRWLWAGIAAAIISMGAMTGYHIWEGMRAAPPQVDAPAIGANTESDAGGQPEKVELTPTRLAADGQKMRLIKTSDTGQMFYADTTLVTFHDYLAFLNEIAGQVSVTEGVVRRKETILFYLEEKVSFNKTRFHLTDDKWAALPATRVTWHGARAYARHYDKRLISYAQWSILRQQVPETIKPSRLETSGPERNSSGHMGMMHTSVPQSRETARDADDVVAKEWVRIDDKGRTASRVVKWPAGGESPTLLRRYPWEGFTDVGFRTSMDIPGDLQK